MNAWYPCIDFTPQLHDLHILIDDYLCQHDKKLYYIDDDNKKLIEKGEIKILNALFVNQSFIDNQRKCVNEITIESMYDKEISHYYDQIKNKTYIRFTTDENLKISCTDLNCDVDTLILCATYELNELYDVGYQTGDNHMDFVLSSSDGKTRSIKPEAILSLITNGYYYNFIGDGFIDSEKLKEIQSPEFILNTLKQYTFHIHIHIYYEKIFFHNCTSELYDDKYIVLGYNNSNIVKYDICQNMFTYINYTKYTCEMKMYNMTIDTTNKIITLSKE